MCIHIVIAPLDQKSNRVKAKDVAAASGLMTEDHGRGSILLSPAHECGCGFASGASPVSGEWSVREDLQAPLEAAVRYAASAMKRFRFTASWMGDPVPVERAVTVDELIAQIRGASIANQAFIVRG